MILYLVSTYYRNPTTTCIKVELELITKTDIDKGKGIDKAAKSSVDVIFESRAI